MQYSSNRNNGCRILEYTFNNTTYLRMENNLIWINICVDKGTDITQIGYKPMDLDFMWKSISAPVNDFSKHIPTINSKTGNNLDYYMGGWHEVFPGGGPYTYKGAEFGIHGELTLLTWQFNVVQDSAEEIAVEFFTYTVRAPFKATKTITIKKDSLSIEFLEKIENLSNEEFEFLWGHHPVVGAPFLNSSCEINIDGEYFITDTCFDNSNSYFENGKRYSFPMAKCKDEKVRDMRLINETPNAELMYFPNINKGHASIYNKDLKIGIGFEWDKTVFDTVWCWRVLNGLPGYPWYGREYCVGIEFWNGYPRFDVAKKQGTLKKIKDSIITKYVCKILI